MGRSRGEDRGERGRDAGLTTGYTYRSCPSGRDVEDQPKLVTPHRPFLVIPSPLPETPSTDVGSVLPDRDTGQFGVVTETSSSGRRNQYDFTPFVPKV